MSRTEIKGTASSSRYESEMGQRGGGTQFLRDLHQLIAGTAVGTILHLCPLLGFVTTAATVEVSAVSKSLRDFKF